MRCGCPDCGAYMVHADGPELGCVCPQCGRHCRDCLGMSAPLTREQLHAMAQQPGAFDGFFAFEGRETPPRPPVRTTDLRAEFPCNLDFCEERARSPFFFG